VDSTIEQGVIVSSPSASQTHVRAMDFGDSSAMAPAPIGALQWITYVAYHWKGTESSKGENFLDNQIHTPPQSKSPSPQPFLRGWAMGRGRGMGRKGPKRSTEATTTRTTTIFVYRRCNSYKLINLCLK